MEKVAKISKLYGSDGEAVINLYSTFPDEFSLDEPIFIKVDSLSVPLYFESFERRGRSNAVVKFADIDTERRIVEFLGFDLLLPESEEEEIDDEFFMEDLVGFRVEVMGEEPLTGELTDYIHSEVNPLFEVRLAGRAVLVPAVEEFIYSIDFDAHTIRFTLPEGLINL
ncbi:MAG: ribosome maturation factor RimM [Rikenellaceae bacterium]